MLFSLIAALPAAAVSAFAAQTPGKSFCKEVLVLHHSHLDVGFTHPQSMLWELQKDFINQALQMLDDTADWPEISRPRWTCEVTAPVSRWLETAGPAGRARFEKYLKAGRIGISAWQYNTTPLCNAEGLARQLYPARALRERFGAKINTAHCHDVSGLPWPVVDLLLDSDVELLVMGINLHLSGTPMPRPAVYRWRGPSGRELLVMNGEHYSMFDQWLDTGKNSLDAMSEGLAKYLRHLEEQKYPYDFVYLTATCAPFAYDNSPPNMDVAKLVRRWNDEGRQPRIRFVTPQQLLQRIGRIPRQSLPVMSGDWTDYWNFGAASSATETRMVRNAAADLAVIDLLQAFAAPDARLEATARRIWSGVNLYNEHTWGAWDSLNHDGVNATVQWQLKAHPAYEAAPLADYVLVRQLQRLAGNPPSAWSQEGVLIVNPGGSALRYHVPVPDAWRTSGRRIESGLMKGRDRHLAAAGTPLCGPVELAPFSWKVIPLAELLPVKSSELIQVGKDFIQSPYHRLTFDPATGRITGLLDTQRHWQVLDTGSPWGFFQLIHEKPDSKVDPGRSAFHVRSVVNERVGLTGWKPGWKAVRAGSAGNVSCRVERSAREATLVLHSQAEGLKDLEQRVTLRADSPLIELSARFLKLDVRSPESLYFAFPLNLPEGWRSHFDTAGAPTELDAEQIPGTCRDWVTVDSFVSMHRGERGATLYCPDAPMVQIGDFNFGRKQAAIPRRNNPLLLAWPLNNYWETNFRASQPGLVEFRYALSSHDGYDPARAAREARQVASPPLVHPVMNCPKPRDGQFLQVKGAGIEVLHVKPAEDGDGIVVRLLNLGLTPFEAELTCPGRQVASAWLTGAVEQNRERLTVQNSTVRCPLPSRRPTTIRVRF
jgi:hypothetical protein